MRQRQAGGRPAVGTERSRDRDTFVALMATEGVPVAVARELMRHATTLHRLAELECGSEEAYNDRLPCPRSPEWRGVEGLPCLCDYEPRRIAAQHDRAKGVQRDRTLHVPVPRYAVRMELTQRKVERLLGPFGVAATFNGDPRGAPIVLKVPSGKGNSFEGICVPFGRR